MIRCTTLLHLCKFYGDLEYEYNQQIRAHIQKQMKVHLTQINDYISSINDNCNHVRTIKLHDYFQDINYSCTKIKQLSNELDNNFMLFIMGGGKNGKSTLINALLGKQVAKEGNLPETWKIDIFTQKDDNHVNFKHKDGSVISLDEEQALRLLADEEKKQKESKHRVNQELREFKKTEKHLEVLEQKKQELQKYELYHSNITEAEWPINGSPILDHYRIVDTPGLKQEIDDMVIASARDYYSKADGVIWVLPGDKIAGSGDRSEIDDLQHRFGKRQDNIIAVINRIDTIIENGQSVDEILVEAKRLYGDIFTEFIPISAKQAREAQEILLTPGHNAKEIADAQKLYEKSNMPALMNLLKRTLFANALHIQIESKIRGSNSFYDDICHYASQAVTLLKDVNSQRIKRQQNWQSEKDQLLKVLSNELEHFKTEEAQRIRGVAVVKEDYLWNLSSELRNSYIISNIICPSEVEHKLKSILINHSRRLSDMTLRHLNRAPFKEFPDLNTSGSMTLVPESKSLGDANISGDITGAQETQIALGGVLAIGAAALLGPIGLVFAGLAASDFGKSVAKFFSRTFGSSLASKIESRFSNQMNQLINDLTTKYTDYLDQSDKQIAELRESTYAELYGPSAKSDEIIEILTELQDHSSLTVVPLHVKELLFAS